MKNFALLVTLSFFSLNVSFAQQSNNSGNSSIKIVSSNQVSGDTEVHTLQLNIPTTPSQDDQLVNPETAATVKKMNAVLAVYKDIRSYSYDRATQTYTIVTAPGFDINSLTQKLNETR